jgi:alpha-L-arabinofuranosidase
LQVDLAAGTTGTAGFANTGYWGISHDLTSSVSVLTEVLTGIKVQSGWTYTGSFYVKSSNYAGPVTVSLQGNNSGTVYATATPVSKVTDTYNKYTFTLKPTSSAPDEQNVFTVQLVPTGEDALVYFGLFSLFPPTFKNRPNGLRIDLAEAMAATAPKIWRFPGGNNLEGESIQGRWKWNETIGPYVPPEPKRSWA